MRIQAETKRGWLVLMAVAILGIGATAGQAQESGWTLEAYGGAYLFSGDAGVADAKSDFDDDAPTFGLRGGYRVSPSFGMILSTGWMDLDEVVGAPLAGSNLEVDLFLVDYSFVWYIGTKKRFYFYGGPGIAALDARLTLPGDDNDRAKTSETKATVHVGFGSEWNLGERGYLRLQNKVRRYDSDIYEGIDIEPSLAFGLRF